MEKEELQASLEESEAALEVHQQICCWKQCRVFTSVAASKALAQNKKCQVCFKFNSTFVEHLVKSKGLRIDP